MELYLDSFKICIHQTISISIIYDLTNLVTKVPSYYFNAVNNFNVYYIIS